MKTAEQIYIDFKAMEEQVEKLRHIAQQEEQVSSEGMKQVLGTIAQNWQGENADLFLEKAGITQEKISTQAAEINRIADTVEKIAINYRDAELAAIRVAEEDSSQGSNS